MATIKEEIELVCSENNQVKPGDFDFLIDIAGLVVAARRSVSYLYPYRYNLYGDNKQRYFDFIQGDLEQSLEKLNEMNEENWLEYLDQDMVNGKPRLGERFFAYKQRLTTLQSTAEKFLNSTMHDIEEGLPSIAKETKHSKGDYMFEKIAKNRDWKCRTCMDMNKPH